MEPLALTLEDDTIEYPATPIAFPIPPTRQISGKRSTRLVHLSAAVVPLCDCRTKLED